MKLTHTLLFAACRCAVIGGANGATVDSSHLRGGSSPSSVDFEPVSAATIVRSNAALSRKKGGKGKGKRGKGKGGANPRVDFPAFARPERFSSRRHRKIELSPTPRARIVRKGPNRPKGTGSRRRRGGLATPRGREPDIPRTGRGDAAAAAGPRRPTVTPQARTRTKTKTPTTRRATPPRSKRRSRSARRTARRAKRRTQSATTRCRSARA